MKKMLLILGAVGLTATSASIVVSCQAPSVLVEYQSDTSILKQILQIDQGKLDSIDNAEILYKQLDQSIKDLNKIEVESKTKESQDKLYYQTIYTLTIKDKNNQNMVNENGTIDYGAKGDKRYLKVEYKKQLIQGQINASETGFEKGSEILKIVESDWASFSIINKN